MRRRAVLPPTYFLGALVMVALLNYFLPSPTAIPIPWHLIGIAPVVVGIALVVLPARTFESRGTAIKPFEQSAVLVQDGFFAVSRNPMYLGMVMVVFGLSVLLGGAVALVVPVVLAVALYIRFIRFEERALEQHFGDEYRAYKARVRRWL